jgi:hypothetical protein
MASRKRIPKHRNPNRRTVRVAFAWYTQEQWALLREYATDADALDDTFEQWERQALHTLSELRRSGIAVEKVDLDIGCRK